MQNGDSLTFQINIVQISCSSRYSEHSAFAAVLGDGSVATWRDREHGAESTAVQEPLQMLSRFRLQLRPSLPFFGVELS